MNMMKKSALIVFFIYACSLSAFAGDFDGSRSLLCSTVDLVECLPGGNCQQVTHDSINAPKFLKINFKEKSISKPDVGEKRPNTMIERMQPPLFWTGKNTDYRPNIATLQKSCRPNYCQSRPSSSHMASTLSITSADIFIGFPHSRVVSPPILLVASNPIFDPSPDTGEAKSR